MTFQRTLILAPHPDDEVLGCGGLMSIARREGWQIHLAVATTNNSEVRLRELDKVCEFFAVTSLSMFYPNASFWLDAIPLADLVRHVERCVESVRPSCVVIPFADSFHQEHRVLAESALAALRPAGGTGRWRPNMVMSYETPFDSWSVSGRQIRPTYYLGLNQHNLDDKLAGMGLHASQYRPAPSERSTQAITGLAMLRGSQCGYEYAEAYEVLRCVS